MNKNEMELDIKKYLQRKLGTNYNSEKERNLFDVCSFIVENKSKRSFRTTLFGFIDEKGLDDVAVYKKAGVLRNVFSCIKKDGSYQVSKKTAIRLAIGMELTVDETLELLNAAGYTLNMSDPFDLIVLYHLEKKDYDIFTINLVLNDLTGTIL